MDKATQQRSTWFDRWGYRLVPLIVVAALGTISFHRAYRERFDFRHFYLDARYVWLHGELNPDLDGPDPDARRQLPFYLPVVGLLLAPTAFAGVSVAAGIWAAGQVLCIVVSLQILWRWCRRWPGVQHPRRVFAVFCLLATPALYEAGKFNQMSFPVLALLLVGIALLEARRGVSAGAFFGLAALIKLLPAIVLVWLLLKRRWCAALAMVACVAVIALVPCLIAFGPAKTWQYHREWWQHNAHGAPAQGMSTTAAAGYRALEDHFIDRRNQSLSAVFARLFTAEHPMHVAYQPITVSPAAALLAARAVAALLLVGLLWATRRAWERISAERGRREFVAYMIAMMVLAPLLRQYYLVWALPALVVFVCRAAAHGAGRVAARLGVAVWLLGMALWPWAEARVCGAHWLMLAVMGVLLLAVRSPEDAFADGGAARQADGPVTTLERG